MGQIPCYLVDTKVILITILGCVVELYVTLLDPIFLFFGLPPLLCHPHYLIIVLTTLCLPFS